VSPETPQATGDPAAPAFQPFDQEGGLVFVVSLPGSEGEFPAERGAEFAERAWARLGYAPAGDAAAVWVHLDRTKRRAQEWIRGGSGLPPLVAEALLAEETRPRAVEREDGLVVILRGVNLNVGAEPDELIVIRLWIEARRAITLRQFRFATIRALRESAQAGRAPATPAALLVSIANGLSVRLGPVVENLQNLLDESEDRSADDNAADLDTRSLAEVRRQAIRLRRFLAPQRDALLVLASSPCVLLDQASRAELQEIAQRTARYVEDLEEVRDRAAVAQEEVRAARERRNGRTMYLLTLVAGVFLPLGFVTGLLGINVGGMPGAESPGAFWVVSVGLVVLAGVLVGAFRWLRWL